ncbi:hypothetical protein AURDEDRAFT_176212 [Auricularia subglabra TFB-10046 SS5]|nr:hypothetical protein AURDEDRAFT_176212 [Auricularia subglabra TFB-10046 SS5]
MSRGGGSTAAKEAIRADDDDGLRRTEARSGAHGDDGDGGTRREASASRPAGRPASARPAATTANNGDDGDKPSCAMTQGARAPQSPAPQSPARARPRRSRAQRARRSRRQRARAPAVPARAAQPQRAGARQQRWARAAVCSSAEAGPRCPKRRPAVCRAADGLGRRLHPEPSAAASSDKRWLGRPSALL